MKKEEKEEKTKKKTKEDEGGEREEKNEGGKMKKSVHCIGSTRRPGNPPPSSRQACDPVGAAPIVQFA
jgi:hypothetical protein